MDMVLEWWTRVKEKVELEASNKVIEFDPRLEIPNDRVPAPALITVPSTIEWYAKGEFSCFKCEAPVPYDLTKIIDNGTAMSNVIRKAGVICFECKMTYTVEIRRDDGE